jgi:ribosome-associated toxin RatA of RatAB toxin-antitoxin module
MAAVPESAMMKVGGEDLEGVFMRVRYRHLSTSLVLSLAVLLGALIFPAIASTVNISMPGDVESQTVKTLNAHVTIDAPPSLVWQTITDYNRLKNILPGYEKSLVLKHSGSVKTVDVAMKVARLLPTYQYQVSVREDRDGYKLQMDRVSGDFKSLQAAYRLQPVNDGKQTMMFYSLALNTGFTMPGTGALLKSNTEKTMTALRTHIEAAHKQNLTARR